jgi:GNAT superfamily N-acetyltransferase
VTPTPRTRPSLDRFRGERFSLRYAVPEDLPALTPLMLTFFSLSNLIGKFDEDCFGTTWRRIIDNDWGVIILLEDASQIVGCISGAAFPDIHTGELVASESCWFVMPQSRGFGMTLLEAFEEWSKSRGCKQLRMAHLMDSMPEKLGRLYRRLGYVATEVHYVKSLGSSPLPNIT